MDQCPRRLQRRRSRRGVNYEDATYVKLALDEARAIASVLAAALRRLAVPDEMAGMGDVTDPEGLARISYARRALDSAGYSVFGFGDEA